MLKELLKEQKRHLEFFYENFDDAQAETVLNLCLNTRGIIILSGVGKSGIIAEKIVMTLVSTGTKALYLPPLNFLHGDIGIVSPEDTVIFLSKSGETEELLYLVPFVRKKGAKIVALVSNLQSRLALEADIALALPVEKELCPFDLAPTTSAEVQLLFGDVLTMGLMKKRGLTLASYSENHPSGSIGKKSTIKVADIMVKDLPICKPTQTLQDVLPEFSSKRLGCVLVVDAESNFQGIFTDGDLRRSLQALGSQVMEKSISELMTRAAVNTHPDILAWEALKLMQKDPKRWIMVLPVVENNRAVGVVRMHDIIHVGIT